VHSQATVILNCSGAAGALLADELCLHARVRASLPCRRVSATYDAVTAAISSGKLENLVMLEQARQELQAGNIFHGLVGAVRCNAEACMTCAGNLGVGGWG
jgi:hypothetical protein